MKPFRHKTFSETQPAAPYAHIAEFYDRLMAHVDYSEWADYLEACFKVFGNEGITRILDGGCGTGSLLSEMKKRGYSVSGFDLSEDMIRIARTKGVPVWRGDLRAMASAGPVDSIICLYDTIHYLNEKEVSEFFNEACRLLKNEGLFIFDAVTENHVRNYWADYTEQGEECGCSYLRRSWYETANRCQHTEFEITVPPDETVFQEHHRQWIHPVPFFIENAEHSGFSLLGVFDECTFEEGHTHSDRVHLVFSRRPS